MSGRVPIDESGQVGNVYALAQSVSHDAILQGYDNHAVAEALLNVARDVLADDVEFWSVFERFKALRWP